MESINRDIRPCLPFLYPVKSFQECFGETVRYIIQPLGYDTVIDNKGLVIRYCCDNEIESVFLTKGKYYKSRGSVWVDMSPDIWPKKLITTADDIEITEDEGRLVLDQFNEKYESLLSTCNEINLEQLVLYLCEDTRFTDTLSKSAVIIE